MPAAYLKLHGGNATAAGGGGSVGDGHSGGRCWRVPHVWQLSVSNRNWQVMRPLPARGSDLVAIYLYGAYFDDRLKEEEGGTVRIVGITDSDKLSTPINVLDSYVDDWKKGRVKIADLKT